MRLKKPTSKKGLIIEFRDPRVIDQLVTNRILNAVGNNQDDLLPTALAFHYSGDSDALNLARRGVGVVLQALQGLFDEGLEKDEFNPEDVKRKARNILGFPPVEEEIWIGLYLAPEFDALSTWSTPDQTTGPVTFRISTNIVTLGDFDGVWDRTINMRVGYGNMREKKQLNPLSRPCPHPERFL